jgi:hypothetical protein
MCFAVFLYRLCEWQKVFLKGGDRTYGLLALEWD